MVLLIAQSIRRFLKKGLVLLNICQKRNNLDNKEVMLIFNKKFSVAPITTHINLNDVQKNISKDKIIKKILTISSFFNSKFKKSKNRCFGLKSS